MKTPIKPALLAALLMTGFSGAMAQSSSPVPATEQSDVTTLKPAYPHRVFVQAGFEGTGVKILNGDTGAYEAAVPTSEYAVFNFDPSGKYFYVSESIWTKGNRGTRQDMVTVYDGATLKLVTEIPLAGRLIIDQRPHLFDINASGKLGFVYNMSPASSVIVVDLEKRKVASTVEVPGCALAFAWGENGFSSLCGDGSLATAVLNGTKATVTHSAPFFDSNNDPIFEQSLTDHATGKAVFISFTGLIYTAQLGATPTIDKPWSIQAAAGLPAAGTGVQELAWRPGGLQTIAWNKGKGRIYVLMHAGNHWTHKKAGSEVWVLDLANHTMIKRLKLDKDALAIAVSQDNDALLYTLTEKGKLNVLDAETGATKVMGKIVAGHTLWVPGF